MNATHDRLPCQWCSKRAQCDPQCKYYAGAANIKAQDNKLPSKIQELAYEFKIQEAMSQDVIVVTPDNTMNEVRELLLAKRISGLPVVEHEQLVGIISLDNFIRCIINGGVDDIVRDNMTLEVNTLYHDEPLIHAISKFEKFGYGRFPVLDRDTGKLVGIITKGDVIKCLLQKLEIEYEEEEIQRYRASHLFEDIRSDETSLILKRKIIGGNYKSAGEQSSYLKVSLLRLGIPSQIARRVIVASCEAEMNIIMFTEGGELVVCVKEDRIQVNAIDNGPGIPDIEKAMQPGYSTAPDWVRDMGFGAGMGLPNIKSCSDEMRIDSKPGAGTNVEFVVFMEK